MSQDDRLQRLLRDEVPSSQPGYWATIDARLEAAAGEDADNSPKTIALLALAAVAVLIAGAIGFFALRDTQRTEVDIADDGTAEPEPSPVDEPDEVLEPVEQPEETPAPTYRCFAPEFDAPELADDFWIIEFTGTELRSLEQFPAFEDTSAVFSIGTIDSDRRARVRSTALPNGRSNAVDWFFSDDRVETSAESVGIEIDCGTLDDFEALKDRLNFEHANLIDQADSLNIAQGEPGRVATVGSGIELNQLPLFVLPGPDALEYGRIGDDLNNVPTSGRTATVDGVEYTELQIPLGSFDQFGWIANDMLRPESRPLADLNATQSGGGFGVIEAFSPRGENGMYSVVIDGEEFLLFDDVTIVDGGVTTLGLTFDEAVELSLLSPGTTVEFIVNPTDPDFGTITDLRIVGILAG